MSLLTIVQTACGRIGIAIPTAVATSTDTQVLQLMALANEEGEELSTGMSVGVSFDWQSLQREGSFSTVATEDQGAIETIAPGFKYILDETIWDRTKRLPVYGSVSAKTWQTFKSWGVASPYPKYRVRGGRLLLMPVPAAGDSYYFEYQTKYWATSSDGATLKAAFTADADVSLLDEQLITAGLIWRWKAAKGFDYAEDMRKYQMRATNAMARDVERPMLSLGQKSPRTGIVVPIGSWNA
jgi:hypothetical protein